MTDEELAIRCQAGDKAAEAELTSRYWDIARFEAKEFRVGGTDIEDRHAIALGACIAAFRSWEPGKGTKVRSYTKRCIRRKLIDLWRSVSRPKRSGERDALSIDSEGDSGLSIADSTPCEEDVESRIVAGSDARLTFDRYRSAQIERVKRIMANDLTVDPNLLALRDAMIHYVKLQRRQKVLTAPESRWMIKSLGRRSGQGILYPPDEIRMDGKLWQRVGTVIAEYLSLEVLVCDDLASGCSAHEVRARHDVDATMVRLIIDIMRASMAEAA